MSTFETYCQVYRYAMLERTDGVLTVTLHSKGDSLRWGDRPLDELPNLFWDIAQDEGNEVVILTGTGNDFIADYHLTASQQGYAAGPFEHSLRNHRRVLLTMLEIGVPVIAAVNGPARIHAEYALLADIVLAAETAEFQDRAHIVDGIVPGDGSHAIWPALIGMNRANYYLLTSQVIGAREALNLGIVNEVLPGDALMARANELAGQLMQIPVGSRRLTRRLFTRRWKRLMQDDLDVGLLTEELSSAYLFQGRSGAHTGSEPQPRSESEGARR